MSYDPNRTTVLPEIGFPITEELPPVAPRRGGGAGSGGSGFLKIAAFLLIAAMIAIATVLFIGNQQSDQTATVDADPGPTATAVESAAAPTPAVVDVDDTEPGFWQVTGVPDGLNVRSGPGVSNEIVGSLRAGDRHIFGTGERVNVNGAEWTQVIFDENDSVGWVSSQFLAVDTPPDPNAPTPTAVPPPSSTSIVCFESAQEPTRVARLAIANGNISGVIRTIEGQTTSDQTVTGTLDSGQALITLTTESTGASSQRTWTFRPANVDLGNGIVLSVVSCASVAGQLP